MARRIRSSSPVQPTPHQQMIQAKVSASAAAATAAAAAAAPALAPIPAPALAEQPIGKMSRSESASHAAKSRWASEEATETEVRELFSELPTEEAVQLLSKMRINCDIAATAINNKMTADSKYDLCHTCGKRQPTNRNWAMIKVVKHPVMRKDYNIFFCTNACVAMENIKKQGVVQAPVPR